MEWYRDVQFVAAVPMPVEWAREYGTTVNGMWDDPARWGRAEVEQTHSEGRRVLVSVPLIALTHRAYEKEENRYLLGEICSDIFGDKAEVKWYYWDSKPVYSMCLYSRVFRDYLLGKCRRAAALGVDVLNVDEIQTSIGLMSREPGGSGFCPRCLEKFCAHLDGDRGARRRAHVADVSALRRDDHAALLERLRSDEAFFRQYEAYHEQAAFDTVRDFLDEIRSCAGEVAKDEGQMALTANLTGIGTFLEANGRLWGAMWGELVDFVMMENIYLTDPGALHTGPGHHLLPRGKFTAWYRLASSFSSRAPAWLCPQIYVPKQLAGKTSLNYYLLMFLESYANNGRWGYYWWPGVDEKTRLAATVPPLIKEYTRFITKHREYYEGCSSNNQLAVLYANSAILESARGHFKYLSLAQALAEAGFQYDVLYCGDDVFTPGELPAEKLAGYRAMLVPEAGQLTPGQTAALRAYAEKGGRVIAYSPNDLGNLAGVTTIPDGRLLDFWREYQDDQRLSVVAPLEDFGEARIHTSDASVNVIRYQKGDQEICHVLNYNYREADDTVAPGENVEIAMAWPGEAAPNIRWLTLEGEQRLPANLDDGRLSFTIPKLDPYGLAVIK